MAHSTENPADETIEDRGDQPLPTEWTAPYIGSKQMPRWDTGVLGKPPLFGWRQIPLMLGPGLVLGAAAVGGGEWLTGPFVSARYGGALLWLAMLSIVGQVLYNIEISRYTLYSGEPIFTGKFRTMPGPIFWLGIYLLLDLGSFLPYLASNAAIPFTAMVLGRLPELDPSLGNNSDRLFVQISSCVILLLSLSPMIFGGKVYNSMKYMMSFKLIVVIGFLLFLAIGYSTWSTWVEITYGFVRVGTLPFEGDTPEDPPQLLNVFYAWWSGHRLPAMDLSMIGLVTAMAAIAGNGGLTNTPISNYTRDQGWGMGKSVGAISSIVGGQNFQLSHVGKVFQLTPGSFERWKGWVKHVQREQFWVWMPACFLGMALPSMLSIQFLERGVVPENKWLAAGMTADGVAKAVGGSIGPLFWYLTLFCGVLILSTSSLTTAEGALRRWVDIAWTASPQLRKWDPHWIGRLFFGAVVCYAMAGLFLLNFVEGDQLLIWTTTSYNFALGLSCWHVIIVNMVMLPKEIRPSIWRCLGLFFAGMFYTLIACVASYDTFVLEPRRKVEQKALDLEVVAADQQAQQVASVATGLKLSGLEPIKTF